MKYRQYMMLLSLFGSAATVHAETVFSDDFQSATISGWSMSGNGNAVSNLYNGNYSLRVNRSAAATKTLSTEGYDNVQLNFDLAAYSLERNDQCAVETSSNGGQNWQSLLVIANGQDNSNFYGYSGTPLGSNDNADFLLRVRADGNRNNDYCYLDNIALTGTPINSSPSDPIIAISGTVDFGIQTVNTTEQSTLIISNTGDGNAVFADLPAVIPPFQLLNDTCSSQSLAPNTQCALTIAFSPTSEGSFSQPITLTYNGAQQANTELVGEGTQGDVVCNFDCLPGDGNVNRSAITVNQLTGNVGNGALVDFEHFALPNNAANPSNTFTGTLSFNGVERGWQQINDPFLYNTLAGIKQLPNFNYEFVQHGTHLIPKTRGLIENATALGQWDLILEPGRVWNENTDQGYSRVALPFALVEYNQNCTHNGVLTFLFNDSGQTSNLQYQIASETCAYYQFNLYGRLNINYTPHNVVAANTIKADYELEVSQRIPVKPIASLATDFPAANITVSNIAGDQSADDLSLFGVMYQGTHYRSQCNTRYGDYPFCDVMTLPSYSTAKTTVAGLALMRLEQKYPGAKDATVFNTVPECSSAAQWGDVTLENALDMATGSYQSSDYEVDEANYAVDWLYSNSHAEKINIACQFYSRQEQPGTRWVYHSSDTYLVGRGVNQYLQNQTGGNTDFFTDLLVAEVYTPLALSPSMSQSIRTRDSVAAAVAGLGVFYHADDVVKLAAFLNNNNGQINGSSLLDTDMLNASLQRDPANRGLPLDPTEIVPSGYYKNSIWSFDLDTSTVVSSCQTTTWIPYMSGYGGIGIQMLPNGMTYYFFSDGFNYNFTTTLNELNKISPLCL